MALGEGTCSGNIGIGVIPKFSVQDQIDKYVASLKGHLARVADLETQVNANVTPEQIMTEANEQTTNEILPVYSKMIAAAVSDNTILKDKQEIVKGVFIITFYP